LPQRVKYRQVSVMSRRLKHLWYVAALLMTAVVFARAQRLPFMDDWIVAEVEPTSAWMLEPYNEHRFVWTNLLLIGFHFIHASIPVMVLFNFALYLTLCLTLIHAHQDSERDALPWLLGLAMLSPLAWEVHVYALNSNITLTYLFLCLGALSWQRGRTWIGGLFLAASVYASAAGVVGALVVTAVMSWWKRSSAAAAIVLLSLGAWLLWRPPHVQTPPQSPLTSGFWDFFLNLVSFGAGFSTRSAMLGVLVLAVTSCALFSGRRDKPAHIALALSGLAIMALLAYGRTGTGEVFSKVSRYFPPALLWLWGCLSVSRAGLVPWLLLTGFLNDFDPYVYRNHQRRIERGCACVRAHIRDHTPIFCPDIYPAPIDAYVAASQAQNLGLTRDCE
jgi:hypothetical protein